MRHRDTLFIRKQDNLSRTGAITVCIFNVFFGFDPQIPPALSSSKPFDLQRVVVVSAPMELPATLIPTMYYTDSASEVNIVQDYNVGMKSTLNNSNRDHHQCSYLVGWLQS